MTRTTMAFEDSGRRSRSGSSTNPGRGWWRTGAPWIGVCLGAFGGGTARAEWDSEKYLVYDFGKLTLRPQLELASTYDSNLFFREEDIVSDFYFSIRPGANFVYGDPLLNFTSFRYTLDISQYVERTDLDNIGHLFRHQSRYRFTRWVLQGTDDFTITQALLGGSFAYIDRRVGLVSLRDNWRADYEISTKASAGVRLGFDYADYDEDDLKPNHLYDYTSYVGGVRFGYLPSDKITVFPEIAAGQTFLSRNNSQALEAPDLSFYSFSVGAEGEFTPKLTGIVSFGYEIRDYADGTDVPDGWIADLQMRWRARPKTLVTLGYRHFIQASREASGIAFTADRPMVSVQQEFGTQGRWSARLSAYYEIDAYDRDFIVQGVPVSRDNDLAGVNLRATYRWQPWLTVSAGYDFYTYSDTISTIPDYDVHRVSLRFTAGY